MTCGCPDGRVIADPARHAAWHEQIAAAGIAPPAGLDETYAARGYGPRTTVSETLLDTRARDSGRRASGAARRAAHG